MMARLRTNRPLTPLETIEAAQADPFDAMTESIMASTRQKWFVGTGDDVRAQLSAFAAQHGVDEIMVSPVAGAYEGETSEGRAQTLELLAAPRPSRPTDRHGLTCPFTASRARGRGHDTASRDGISLTKRRHLATESSARCGFATKGPTRRAHHGRFQRLWVRPRVRR